MQRCFSPEVVPSGEAPVEEGPLPRGGVFGLIDAVVLTTAIAGVATPAVFAGAVAPADLAGTDVPAIAEKEFTAVAEDYFLVFGLNEAVVLMLWCGRRLVSANSSPLTVRGELEMTVVFPSLNCEMLLVVSIIGSDGLLGTEALQSCLPHQLDLRTGNCGRRDD